MVHLLGFSLALIIDAQGPKCLPVANTIECDTCYYKNCNHLNNTRQSHCITDKKHSEPLHFLTDEPNKLECLNLASLSTIA
jgi:hypothetical protein